MLTISLSWMLPDLLIVFSTFCFYYRFPTSVFSFYFHSNCTQMLNHTQNIFVLFHIGTYELPDQKQDKGWLLPFRWSHNTNVMEFFRIVVINTNQLSYNRPSHDNLYVVKSFANHCHLFLPGILHSPY